ncbi:MAG: acetoin utilization protein AcuC [Thermoplasmata archaeon]|nr:acetoin utilization protein AcuC [Thermoplasmata archaeon]
MVGPRATLLWDDRLLEYEFGPTHPFQVRYRADAAQTILAEFGPQSRVPAIEASGPIDAAPSEVLGRFHTPKYVAFVGEMAQRPPGSLLDRGDTPAFPGCDIAAARVVGAALTGLQAIVEGRTVRAFSPAGGLHHAHPSRASGFCIFNDLAVAIASGVRPGGPFRRVAYIDLDVHHGDGVMYGFYDDGRVLDIDLHQDGRTLFPGTGAAEETGRADGAGLKVNLPVPPGAGDGTLLPLLRRVAVPLVREFRPDWIVLQHGVDGHAGDGLGQLEYSDAGFAAALDTVVGLADEVCGGRLLVTGGGGYMRDTVPRVLTSVGRRLARSTPAQSTPEVPEEFGVDAIVREAARLLGRSFPAN